MPSLASALVALTVGGPFALLFGALGVRALRAGVATLRVSLRRDEFESVEARVVESELEETYRKGLLGGKTYEPAIEYEYTVAGETHTSDSVYPGEYTGGNDLRNQRDVVDSYPEGAVVEAHYHPEDPSVAFLHDESKTLAALGATVLGSVFVSFAVGVVAVLVDTVL